MSVVDQKSLRALHVYRTYFPDPPGGMQEAIRQLCLATTQCGVQNTIYALSPHPHPAELTLPEGRVVRSLSWAAPASCDLGTLESVQRFRALARESDVLHFLYPWPFGDVLNTITATGTPSVITYVSDLVRQRWLGKLYAPLMWRSLRKASAIVANCPAYANTSPVLAAPDIRDKVRIIPLGIDEGSYPSAGDETILGKLGLGVDEPFIFFIGVLRYYKGLHFLLEAARSIGARVVIAGTGPEGERLQREAQVQGLKNVIFAGQVSDAEKVALLKACRALVLPSHLRSEAYGMVLVEASIFGKPLVSCEIGTGTSFVNADGVSGFVVPPEDPGALAASLNALVRDEALAARLGAGARARYEQMFSGPALGKAYSELFRDVVSLSRK